MNSKENREKKVEDFFTTKEWEKLSDYEKTRYSNQWRNYKVLLAAGLEVKAPAFTLQKKKSKSKEVNQTLTKKLSDGVEGFECDICHCLFSEEQYMLRHKSRHPHMISDRRYKCYICTYSTAFSSNFKSHITQHQKERPHQCPLCEKSFTKSGVLKIHIRTHTGEKPFICNICNKHFSQSSHLRSHSRTHSREKPYRCSECGKDFSSKRRLHTHQNLHTREKPFQCQQCDYKSRDESSLRKHVVCQHIKDFSHVCQHCGKGFYLPSMLKKHEAGRRCRKSVEC